MKKQLVLLGLAIAMVMVITSCDKLDPNAPQACFVTPGEVYAGVPTVFNSSCSVNATTFSWTFGDGGSSTEANPVYTYTDAGSYTVTLTASDDAGGSDEMSTSVSVLAPSFIEHSGNIESDETWLEGVHVVIGDVYVDGAILTIEPGAVIRFNKDEGLYLGYHGGFSGATLIANGTADKPITFTSSAVVKSAGDWSYIGFYDGASTASSMQHCIVEYGGGYSENYGAIYIAGSAVALDNSTIKLSESHGVSLLDEGYFESFTGNTVEENSGSAISIFGNYVHTIGTSNNLVSAKGIEVVGDRMEMAKVTWLKQTVPYVLEDDLYVGAATGANLILDPGVVIRMGEGTGIYIAYYGSTFGTLTAEGTAAEHITITSAAPAGSRSAGDWNYVGFYDGAGTSSTMDYCDLEYGGGYSQNNGMIYVDGSAISLTNSSVMNSEFQGVSLFDDAWFEACTGNTFEGNGSVPIEIFGNYAHTIGTGNTFNTGPGIMVNGDKLEEAEVTWLKQNVPYTIDNEIYLGSANVSKWTIAPGTTVSFTEGSSIYVGYYSNTFGILEADGDADNKITFTSAVTAGFESAGDWNGIFFNDGTSNGTILDNCVIKYGGGYSTSSGNVTVRVKSAGVPVISNCQIMDSESWGIYLGNDTNPTLTDNAFSNNALGDAGS